MSKHIPKHFIISKHVEKKYTFQNLYQELRFGLCLVSKHIFTVQTLGVHASEVDTGSCMGPGSPLPSYDR